MEEEEEEREPFGAKPDLLARRCRVRYRCPRTFTVGTLGWACGGSAAREGCAAFERAGERWLPNTSLGIPTAGKHVNKSVRYRAALIKFTLSWSHGSSLTCLGWMDGSLISAPSPGPLCFQHLLWHRAGLSLLR